MDRVNTREVGAGITASRAARARSRLSGRIVDVITRTRAAVAVESVGKSEPMASLVYGDETHCTLS
jgi:hypothetical protein